MVPAGLVAALMQNDRFRECVTDSGKTPAAYAAGAFTFEHATLRGGERITAVVSKGACLQQGQSIHVLLYRETAGGYRLVLDGFVMDPEVVQLPDDGTITLPAHETMDTIVEQTFVWNGSSYVFDPFLSHRYDVALELRRPYETRVRFAPGTSSTILRGTTADTMGDGYGFEARKGQVVSVTILPGSGKPAPNVYLSYGDKTIEEGEATHWSVTLPSTGTYTLDVLSGYNSPHGKLVPYVVRLEIR